MLLVIQSLPSGTYVKQNAGTILDVDSKSTAVTTCTDRDRCHKPYSLHVVFRMVILSRI